MDEKNIQAMARGPEWMLWKLANLKTAEDVVEFREVFGELVPDLHPEGYLFFANIFKDAWMAKNSEQKTRISDYLTTILERSFDEKGVVYGVVDALVRKVDRPHRMRPAFIADFQTGQITVKPRTLIDWLAQSLLRCRNNLAICERKNCATRYFVKAHARQRFCSALCADSTREKKKKLWWKKNREKFITKWKKERKGKRGKR